MIKWKLGWAINWLQINLTKTHILKVTLGKNIFCWYTKQRPFDIKFYHLWSWLYQELKQTTLGWIQPT